MKDRLIPVPQTKFANPKSMRDHHFGCLILLQYFHSQNRGRQPLALTETAKGLDELRKFGEFDQVQVEFLRRSYEWVRRNCMSKPWTLPFGAQTDLTLLRMTGTSMMEARDKQDFGSSYYFVSQLFDDPWKPSSTA